MVGPLVRERRLRLGWTQTDLAKKAGLSQNYVSKLEGGKIDLPHRGTLQALAGALGVLLSALYEAAGVIDPQGAAPPPPAPADIDDAILADMLAELRERVPPATMDVLREMRELEDDRPYRQAIRILAEAMRANVDMGGRMLRLDWPGREG